MNGYSTTEGSITVSQLEGNHPPGAAFVKLPVLRTQAAMIPIRSRRPGRRSRERRKVARQVGGHIVLHAVSPTLGNIALGIVLL